MRPRVHITETLVLQSAYRNSWNRPSPSARAKRRFSLLKNLRYKCTQTRARRFSDAADKGNIGTFCFARRDICHSYLAAFRRVAQQ